MQQLSRDRNFVACIRKSKLTQNNALVGFGVYLVKTKTSTVKVLGKWSRNGKSRKRLIDPFMITNAHKAEGVVFTYLKAPLPYNKREMWITQLWR